MMEKLIYVGNDGREVTTLELAKKMFGNDYTAKYVTIADKKVYRVPTENGNTKVKVERLF